MRDGEGKVWISRRGCLTASHPWQRWDFDAVRITSTEVVLGDGTRVQHDRVVKIELVPDAYRPGMPLSRSRSQEAISG